MYCMKCGAKLPDTAKFCFNCGSIIVTNPIETTYNFTVDNQKYSINIGKNEIVFNSSQIKEILLNSIFERNANNSRQYLICYGLYEIENFEQLYNEFYESFKVILLENINIGVKTLFKFGVDYYDQEALLNKLNNYVNLDKEVSDYFSHLHKINDRINQLNSEASQRKEQKNPWRGGGFGFGGAIKGAILAGVLNAGANFIGNLEDGLINAFDKNEIKRMKKECYENREKIIYSLSDALYSSVCAIGDTVYGILVQEKIMNQNDWLSSEKLWGKAQNLVGMYNQAEISKDYTIKKLCNCFNKHPFNLYPLRCLGAIDKSLLCDVYYAFKLIGNERCAFRWYYNSFSDLTHSYYYYKLYIKLPGLNYPKLDNGEAIIESLISGNISTEKLIEKEVAGTEGNLTSPMFYYARFEHIYQSVKQIVKRQGEERIYNCLSSKYIIDLPVKELIIFAQMTDREAINQVMNYLKEFYAADKELMCLIEDILIAQIEAEEAYHHRASLVEKQKYVTTLMNYIGKFF